MPTAVRQALAPVCTLSLAIAACLQAGTAHADFIKDSSATLEARNIYLNRDFRDGTGQSKREEWAQGFILNLQSGYTEGTVGVGLDALGMLGVKLDSGRGRSGTDLLPVQDDGGTPDEYSKLGLTAKIRASKSELRLGTHIPELPVVKASDSRILPQVFEGGLLTSREIRDLTFSGGRLSEVKDRASTNSEDLAINNKNKRFAAAATGDHFDLAGADYAFSKQFTGRYYFAELDEVYRQHFFGLLASQPLGKGTLSADLRYAVSDDTGRAKAGKVDNRALNGMLSYGLNAHKVGLGYQRMSGDTGYAYIDGSDPFLVNFVQINDFANADQRSWQARYDLDLAAFGVPGLSFMTRYITSDNAKVAGSLEEGREWERDVEFKYVVQSGPLKDLGFRVRHAGFRSNFARDADELRLIVSYALPIW
ncbi:OprD family porin [Metapseudomonas resinovorans]|uniref:Putative tricarboxylate-specific porin OpdH n=1 Tax=Metapseudomonas resinovorans NBRC 106553 TaxID=1245471 RepID=S6AHL9_METRE|nr:OprD family porin [Pseudomonas resinovorans]BAN50012.1 putative tricarboxylate-specific porin OpdH [Pseudomonas resinovorans NBRC 106553]